LDFTLITYQYLLESLMGQNYSFRTFSEFIENPQSGSIIILRHDVDALPQNSLVFAKIQQKLGIYGSFYFRIVPKSFHEKIIDEIASMGHEIGYHYETMNSCDGNTGKAYYEFCQNLATFRKIVPVKTICMHGSPLSKYDNKTLWKYYNYRDLGIIGEPYFDLDFSKVLYLTDTGRRWDGERFSIRDKAWQLDCWQLDNSRSAVSSQQLAVNSRQSETCNPNLVTRNPNLFFHSTSDIIKAANLGKLPNQIMMTFHPQRWTDNPLPWMKELVLQNIKNVVKRWIVRREA
jgi:hypothetical protein